MGGGGGGGSGGGGGARKYLEQVLLLCKSRFPLILIHDVKLNAFVQICGLSGSTWTDQKTK